MSRLWMSEQEEFVKANLHMSDAELSDALGMIGPPRTRHAIAHWRHEHGYIKARGAVAAHTRSKAKPRRAYMSAEALLEHRRRSLRTNDDWPSVPTPGVRERVFVRAIISEAMRLGLARAA